MAQAPEDEQARVAGILQTWAQGDYSLAPDVLVYRGRLSDSPVTGENLEHQVPGFVVTTQTCDIVRSHLQRGFVEVSPLVEVSQDVLEETKSARRPNFAYLPPLHERRLVVDLDKSMTVAKTVLVEWTRTRGLSTDEEVRRFSTALARKRARFAFPDDFVGVIEPLRNRIREKASRASDEGAAIRALREVRVHAEPSWEAPDIELMMWFIRPIEVGQHKWVSLMDRWLALVTPAGRYKRVDGVVVDLEGMSALDYLSSDPLDVEDLSGPDSRS